LAAVAVKYPAFQELEAEVLAVSVDSVDTHRRWQERELSRMVKGGALFPMLSDPEGKIGTLYGVYDQEKGVDSRGHFLIDPEGRIQVIEIVADRLGRDIAEILRQLRALRHLRATGDFMPCGWQPGKPTLPPETDPKKQGGQVWKAWKTKNAF
jgi:peroxiredoxin (alkyl hydroperoxide reductase subunit C)